MVSKINCSAPQDNTKRNSASPPPPPPSGSSDRETLFIIAICRSRHSKRQRSHISVLSFGLHTRLLSYGRFCSSIKLTGFCYRPPVCASSKRCSTNLVLLCRCTCLMIFATGPPNGKSRNGNQSTTSTPLHRVCVIRLVGL